MSNYYCSLHEIAMYDYPVIFDYILNQTKQENLYFLGHSIGSTMGFIFSSLRPDYNEKIKLHLALAPLVYVNHSITLGHKIIFLPGFSLSVSIDQYYIKFIYIYIFTHLFHLLLSSLISTVLFY